MQPTEKHLKQILNWTHFQRKIKCLSDTKRFLDQQIYIFKNKNNNNNKLAFKNKKSTLLKTN